jgi:hypothetical protein
VISKSTVVPSPRMFPPWSSSVVRPDIWSVRVPVEILTYGYVKPQTQWFSIVKRTPVDPSWIAWGLRGYAHRARSRAPSGEGVWPSLTPLRLPPEARGLPRALGTQFTTTPRLGLGSCQPRPGHKKTSPGLPIPRGLPGDAPEARPCQLLLRQGHIRGVTQEDKAS